MKVPVCLKNNSVLYIEGEVIGIWSVAPALGRRGLVTAFTVGAWSVRSVQTGINIGCFTDRDVALGFAKMLEREYGDISEAVRHCFDCCETDEDAALLDEIQARSLHNSRVSAKTLLPYVKP